MTKIYIKEITLEDLQPLKEAAIKDGILFPKKRLVFLGIKNDNKLLGFGGLSFNKKTKRGVIKCDYIIPTERRKGYASKILDVKLEVFKQLGIKYIEAHCTKAAVNIHVRKGAIINKVYKNGVTKIIYENK